MAKEVLRALTLHRFPPFLTHLEPPLPFKPAIPCSITSHLAGYARNRLKRDGDPKRGKEPGPPVGREQTGKAGWLLVTFQRTLL